MKSLAQHPFFVSDTARAQATEEKRLQLEVSWLLPLSAEQARTVLAAAEKGDYEAVQAVELWPLGRANLAAHLCVSGADFLDVLVSDLSATDLSRLSKDLVALYPDEKERFSPEQLELPLMWLLKSYAESAEQLLHNLSDTQTRLDELRAMVQGAAPLAQLFLNNLLAKFDTPDPEAGEKEATAQKPKSESKSESKSETKSSAEISPIVVKAKSPPKEAKQKGAQAGAGAGTGKETGTEKAKPTVSKAASTTSTPATPATPTSVATGASTPSQESSGGIRIVSPSARKKTRLERFDEIMSRSGDKVPIGSYVKKGGSALTRSTGKVARKGAEQVKAIVPEKAQEETAQTVADKPLETAQEKTQKPQEKLGTSLVKANIAKKGVSTFRDQVRKQRDTLAERAAETKEQREKEREQREKEQAERKAALEQEALERREAEEEAARIAEKEKKINPRAIRVPSAKELQEQRRATLSETAPAEAAMDLPPPDEKVPAEGGAAKKFAPARTPTSKAKRDFEPPTAPRRVPRRKVKASADSTAPVAPVASGGASEASGAPRASGGVSGAPRGVSGASGASVASGGVSGASEPPVLPPAKPVSPSVVKANPTRLARQVGRTRSASRGWQVAGLLALISTAPESLFKGGKLIPSAVPIVLLVVAILLLWDSRTRRAVPPPAAPVPVASDVAFAFATQPGGPEDQPQIGVGNLLSLNEVRYCLYQEQRLQLIREQVNPHSQYETTRYNHEVDDYNQRCLKFRHPQGAVRTVRQEIPEWQDNLAQQAKNIIQGWRTSSTGQ